MCYNTLIYRKGDIMKKIVGTQKRGFVVLLGLIALAEILLRIDNKVIQILGVCLTPFLVVFCIFLLRNDQKSNLN